MSRTGSLPRSAPAPPVSSHLLDAVRSESVLAYSVDWIRPKMIAPNMPNRRVKAISV
ncbi:hypothetical protein VQ056_09855 [Paenibacillus sp. JTLBN-2024]